MGFAFTDPSDSDRPTPAPKFSGDIRGVDRSEVLAYAKSLEFDFSHNVAERDRWVLKSPSGPVMGPYMTLAPEVGWTKVTEENLRRGRIALVFRAEGAVPSAGLTKGDNYVWIEGTKEGLQAFLIPGDASAPIREWRITYAAKHLQDDRGAIVRILSDETAWASCINGCCRIDPL
ncbi:MAG: hypothetical protein ACT4O1_16550 [Gemmatimonadota bacterium]